LCRPGDVLARDSLASEKGWPASTNQWFVVELSPEVKARPEKRIAPNRSVGGERAAEHDAGLDEGREIAVEWRSAVSFGSDGVSALLRRAAAKGSAPPHEDDDAPSDQRAA
jgi:hypothetical protein